MDASQSVRQWSWWWLWYAVPAFLAYVLGYFAGALTGDALLYVAGALLALALLAPVWAKQPRYLLIALTIYLPIEDAILQAFSAHTTVERVIPDALLLLIFCLRLPLSFLRRERMLGTPLDWPLAALLLVAEGSFIYNQLPLSTAVQGIYVLVRYTLVFYLAASSRFTPHDVRVLVRMLVAGASLQCVVGALQFVLLHISHIHLFGFVYVQGTTGYFNVLGMYLAITCIVALACYSHTWMAHPRMNLALLIGSSVAMMILSLSRQSIASLVIGWVGVILLGRRYWPMTRSQLAIIVTAGASIIGFAVLLAVVSPAILPGNSQGTSTSHATPFDIAARGKAKQFNLDNLLSPEFNKNARLYEIVNGGRAVFQQSPLVGFGPGTFGAQASFHDRALYNRLNVGLLLSDPHHIYVADVEWMSIFGQFGLLGLICFAAIFIQIWRLAYRIFKASHQELTRRLALATLALIPVWFVVGFMGPNFELRPISIWIWILPGVLWSLLRQEREAAKNVRVRQAMERVAPDGFINTRAPA